MKKSKPRTEWRKADRDSIQEADAPELPHQDVGRGVEVDFGIKITEAFDAVLPGRRDVRVEVVDEQAFLSRNPGEFERPAEHLGVRLELADLVARDDSVRFEPGSVQALGQAARIGIRNDDDALDFALPAQTIPEADEAGVRIEDPAESRPKGLRRKLAFQAALDLGEVLLGTDRTEQQIAVEALAGLGADREPTRHLAIETGVDFGFGQAAQPA